jgi:transposase InsO family protein
MSRRLRPHYRPATVGYRASRCQARSPRQAGLAGYFPFYNEERIHAALDYRTPMAVYLAA